MRTLSATGQALLGKRLALALLVEMQMSAPVRLATCAVDIDYAGHTYTGGRMVGIDAVRNQGGEIQGLKFSLSGVPSEYLSLALAEQVQGRAVTVYTALMDPDTQALVDVMPLWTGTLDQMPISHGAEACVVSVTAEHRGLFFARPKPLRYTDGDQQRLHPGDKSLSFLVSQSTHQDVWPAAAFFKQ
jgi:hypothetical protein